MRPTRRPLAAVAPLVVAVVVTLLPTGGAAAAPPTTVVATGARSAATVQTVAAAAPRLTFVKRGTGFGSTVLVTSAKDGTGRLFIVDKVGRVLSWVPGQPRAIVYLDLRSRVRSTGTEQGLLGLTFYPDFRRVPLVFVSYTDSSGALQVSRFLLGSYTQATVNPATESKVLRVPHPTYTNHNGGMILFGNDGYFYISTGDGGGAGDPFDNSQRLTTLSGKILRVNASSHCAGVLYCDPTDNPFVGVAGARKEIWHYGLRNPWRFSVDPATGNMWIGDVGQDRYEEVDAVGQATRGRNFGWSCREASSTYNSSRCRNVTMTPPVAVVAHPAAEALIGGVVYRGSAFSATLGGYYVFGDYVTGTLWTMAGPTSAYAVAGSLDGVTSIGTDAAGEIWATTLAGGIYQLAAA